MILPLERAADLRRFIDALRQRFPAPEAPLATAAAVAALAQEHKPIVTRQLTPSSITPTASAAPAAPAQERRPATTRQVTPVATSAAVAAASATTQRPATSLQVTPMSIRPAVSTAPQPAPEARAAVPPPGAGPAPATAATAPNARRRHIDSLSPAQQPSTQPPPPLQQQPALRVPSGTASNGRATASAAASKAVPGRGAAAPLEGSAEHRAAVASEALQRVPTALARYTCAADQHAKASIRVADELRRLREALQARCGFLVSEERRLSAELNSERSRRDTEMDAATAAVGKKFQSALKADVERRTRSAEAETAALQENISDTEARGRAMMRRLSELRDSRVRPRD
jgi:hypothetical protein